MSEYSRKPKRKYCQFCKDHTEFIDYKDSQMLRKFVTDRGKIKPRRVTGNCAQCSASSSPTAARSSPVV